MNSIDLGKIKKYFNDIATLAICYGTCFTNVMGVLGEDLVAGGTIGVASVRSCRKLPPCLIRPVPDGSKTDLLLPKAKPISDGGSTSGITYFRRGRKKTLQ